MRQKRLSAIALIVVALLMPTTLSAQFLQNLGRKAKEKIESKVNKNKKTSAIEANAPTNGSAQNGAAQSNDGGPEVNGILLFPYQPVAKYAPHGLYLNGTQDVENFIYYIYAQISKMLSGTEGMPGGAIVKAVSTIPGEEKTLAYGEPVVNAFFYDFFQKPNDYKAFRQMIKGYIVANAYYAGLLKQKMVEGSDTQAYDKDDKVQNLWESENDRRLRGHMLMMKAEQLAQQSDYNNIFDSTYSMYVDATKAYEAGKTEAAMNLYRELQFSWNRFLTQHPQWKNDNRASQFSQMFQQAMQRRIEIRDVIIDELKEPQPMPKTYSAISGVEAKVRQCIAREDPTHKNAPVVFLSQGWRPLYKSGSKVIDQRAVDVGWTYTDAKGQKWLAYTTMMQKAVYKGLTVTYIDSYMFSGGYKTMKLK